MTINWNFWVSPGIIIGSNERQLLERMMSLVTGSFIYTCVKRLGGVDLNIFTSRKPTWFRQWTCIWLVKVFCKKKPCIDRCKIIQYMNSISSFLLKRRITTHFTFQEEKKFYNLIYLQQEKNERWANSFDWMILCDEINCDWLDEMGCDWLDLCDEMGCDWLGLCDEMGCDWMDVWSCFWRLQISGSVVPLSILGAYPPVVDSSAEVHSHDSAGERKGSLTAID